MIVHGLYASSVVDDGISIYSKKADSFMKRLMKIISSLIIIKTPAFININLAKIEPALNLRFISVKILVIASVFFSPI